MIDLKRYVESFVNPTMKEFEERTTSVRHAFLACVVTFHGVDYLAWPDEPSKLRAKLRRNPDFLIVDEVGYAFKHVATSRRPNKGTRASDVVSRPAGAFDGAAFDVAGFDASGGKVTLTDADGIDLLEAVRATVDFLLREGNDLEVARMLEHRPDGRGL